MRDDAVDDAVTALGVGEAGHGTGAAADLAEGTFDDVGGAHLAPVGFRNIEEAQQVFQIAFDTSHGARAVVLPVSFPLLKGALGLFFAAGAVDR